MRPFDVVEGLKDKATVVCTWCGGKFVSKERLEEHWTESPRCGRNRNVNNPTQEKNQIWEPSDE